MDVGDWGFIEKIAEAFFAFAELIHCADPAKLGGGSGSENLESEQQPRLGRHHADIEYRQVPEDAPLRVLQGDAEVALDPLLLRILFPDA